MSDAAINALFNSAQPYSLELARKLRDSGSIKPVYWLTNGAIIDAVQEAFPGVTCHDQISSYKGMPHPDFEGKGDLDLDVIERLSSREHIVLSMMDRNDSN